MATCFLNNVYCLYLPVHTSHGLQPWDNGPFAVEKGAYRRYLSQLSSLNDSTPGGKIQFINCLIEARKALTPKVLKGGCRHTGGWPISRRKALSHPEIQADIYAGEKRSAAEMSDDEAAAFNSDEDVTFDYITRLGRDRPYNERQKLRKVANTLNDTQAELILARQEIQALEAKIKNLTKGKKRRNIPNPNKRFQKISEVMALGGNPNESSSSSSNSEEVGGGSEQSEDEPGEDDSSEAEVEPARPRQPTRSGRAAQLPARYR